MTKVKTLCRICLPLIFCAGLTLAAQVDVTTQHNDGARTGSNLSEKILTPSNVVGSHFGMLFKRVLDDQAYSQPLIATGIKVGGGTHDLVYLTTVNNSVYAFDANDGSQPGPVWHVNFGTPANLHDAPFGCLDMNGNFGIVGTPVIGLKKQGAKRDALYVVALTRAGDTFQQRLHALDLATGADLPDSPVTITAPQFDPLMQNQRPALALGSGMVYIGYASHCDKQPYHGFLMAYDAQTLQQAAVLNTSPSGEGASIWQSGQAPAIDDAGNVYVVTGNGTWDGTKNFSESFMKLDPKLKLLDWFTPTNHALLDEKDNDLDSSGATLIPGTETVLGGGKEGVLYTLDRDHLGHLADDHATQHFPATSSHLHSLVFWKSEKQGGLLYVWGQRDKARVFQFAAAGASAKLKETPLMTRPDANEGHPGAMLSLSANGGHDGILWAAIHASGDSWHESRPGVLHAYDADDINHELWNSLQNAGRDDCGEFSKMAPPTIANGKVYLSSFGGSNTGTGAFCVYGLLGEGRAPAAPAKLKAEREGSAVHLTWALAEGARTYSVEAVHDGRTVRLASGLTTGSLVTPQSDSGTTRYLITSLNAAGESKASTAVSVSAQVAAYQDRMMH